MPVATVLRRRVLGRRGVHPADLGAEECEPDGGVATAVLGVGICRAGRGADDGAVAVDERVDRMRTDADGSGICAVAGGEGEKEATNFVTASSFDAHTALRVRCAWMPILCLVAKNRRRKDTKGTPLGTPTVRHEKLALF